MNEETAIHRQLVKFLMVGGLAFAVDVSVMAFLVYVAGFADSEPALLGARVIAWGAAITVAFFLNARVTFGASIRHSRFFNYLMIQGVGAFINLGSYTLLIYSSMADWPLLALMIGSALATISNFLLVRRFVYRYHPSPGDPDLNR